MVFNTQPMLTLSNILTKTKEEVNLESLRFLKKKSSPCPLSYPRASKLKFLELDPRHSYIFRDLWISTCH